MFYNQRFKYLITFVILLTIMPQIKTSMFNNQNAEDIGKSFTKGVLSELHTLQPSSQFFEKIINNVFSGISKSMSGSNSKDFQKTLKNEIASVMDMSTKGIEEGLPKANKNLHNAFTQGSNDLGKTINTSSDILGKHLQETFKDNGELDKGLKQAVDINIRNFNRAIDGTIHRNNIKLSLTFTATVASYFLLKYGVPLAYKMLERYLTKPKLIISSSKKTWSQYLFGCKPEKTPMIFSPELEERLNSVIKVTATLHKKINSGSSNVKYRNLMLHGPPGTGKTLFAMELAKHSGLEYVCMSGSSFHKFKDGEGIEALDELFAWANNSKGLLIFIDEAETFLSERSNMDSQSKAYYLLNNFLNYTGTRSNKFMLVFATNHKDGLDSAMYRRIDDLIEISLPGLNERIKILQLYINKILLNKNYNSPNFIKSTLKVLNETKLLSLAERTKGLSAGELEGIINNLKTDSDILNPARITEKLVDSTVQQAIDKHAIFNQGKSLNFVIN